MLAKLLWLFTKLHVVVRYVCLVMLLAISTLVSAADASKELRSAQKLLQAGNYAQAYDEYLQYADSNHLAQFSLGLFHRLGWGRAINASEACHWFEKASEGMLPVALHYLGDCWQTGVYGEIDNVKAAQAYQEAADIGYLGTLCPLGDLYLVGKGVKKDVEKGVNLCQQAASQGVVDAMLRLSEIRLKGVEGPPDNAEGIAWLEKAASYESPEAFYRIGVLFREGFAVEKDLVSARYWFEKAAAKGYLLAYFPTAELYASDPAGIVIDNPDAKILAKTYLWLSASEQRLEEGQELLLVKEWLRKARLVIPNTWYIDLDAKVQAHMQTIDAS